MHEALSNSITIDRLQVFALSCPVDSGPISSLAPMPTRNGVLIAITDKEGAVGWGEAWCNYPPSGNIAKVLLLKDVIAPAILNKTFSSWRNIRPEMNVLFSRMMIHTGEPGPFRHCIAALDMALADIAARRRSLSLSRLLGAENTILAKQVGVYCSTPNANDMENLIGSFEAAGHTCFKLKVGFDESRDLDVIDEFRSVASPETELCMDANQNWSLEQAKSFLHKIEDYAPNFVEEPLPADAPDGDWIELAQSTTIGLAAGENITSSAKFREHIDNKSLNTVQPDVAKWGGVTGAVEVGAYALEHDANCCLHYMGTALGLAASFHCMAAIGGHGRVELDANTNPLRTELGDIDLTLNKGMVNVPEGAGIGFTPDETFIANYNVASCDLHSSKT